MAASLGLHTWPVMFEATEGTARQCSATHLTCSASACTDILRGERHAQSGMTVYNHLNTGHKLSSAGDFFRPWRAMKCSSIKVKLET